MKENVVLAAIILGAAIIAAAILHRDRPCTPATASCNCSPRFQVSVGANHAFIIDTTTGQTWETYLASNSGSTSGDFRKAKLKD